MKNLFSLVALVILVSAMAFAQPAATNGTSAIGTAVFLLEGGLDLEGTDGDWGVLSPGTVYTFMPNGIVTPPENSNGDGTYPAITYWTITSVIGAGIDVTFTLPSFFVGVDFGARIPYTVNSQSAGWFSEEPDVDLAYEPFDPRVPKRVYCNPDGETWVAIGGIVSVGTGLPVEDEYWATFILTANWAGF
ncbi:MAG: hypothetical protein WB626_00765 [Bacteroidota bacterium]